MQNFPAHLTLQEKIDMSIEKYNRYIRLASNVWINANNEGRDENKAYIDRYYDKAEKLLQEWNLTVALDGGVGLVPAIDFIMDDKEYTEVTINGFFFWMKEMYQ